MEETNLNRLHDLANHYGLTHQLRKTQEELHELDEAIRDHLATPTTKTRESVVEELVDCELMLEQIKYLLGAIDDEISLYREFKIRRQFKRIGRSEE